MSFYRFPATNTGLLLSPSGVKSVAFSGGPAATVPAAFVSGNWTATAGNYQIEVNITALPSDGGSAITALQYRLDGGAWVSFAGTGTGVRAITGLTDTPYAVQIRAVNSVGGGTASDTKTRTPTAVAGTLNPELVVEYVDGSGVRHTTPVVDGVTSISGVAPFLVQFDATGTRAPTAFAAQGAIADAEAYAFLMVGYRMNYGEGVGTWDYPTGTTFPKIEDTGPPVYGHIYHAAGTHTARLKARDTLGNESTITCTVVVSAAPAATHIPVSAGGWPTFVSGSRYTLDAGGDYRSFGALSPGGLHNIIFEKTGSGADPRVGSFNPDGRSKFDAVALAEYRSAHIRTINLDIQSFGEGQRGYDYCGVIGGLIREANASGSEYFWPEDSEIVRSNVRFLRGLFLEDTEVRNTASTNGYVMIGVFRSLHARNTRFIHQVNGSSTWGMLRLYGTKHIFRNSFWRCDVNGGSSNGIVAALLSIAGQTPYEWGADDRAGPLASTTTNDAYGMIGSHQLLYNNQIYDAGSFVTNAISSAGGGHPSNSPVVTRAYPRLTGWENNVFYQSGAIALSSENIELYGNYCFARNNRKAMGTGAFVSSSTGAPNAGMGDTVTYNGPFFQETANTRPVPTGF